jgi:hypothetical protein
MFWTGNERSILLITAAAKADDSLFSRHINAKQAGKRFVMDQNHPVLAWPLRA